MNGSVFPGEKNLLRFHHEIKLSWMVLPSFFIHSILISAMFLMAPKPFPAPLLLRSYEVSLVSRILSETKGERVLVRTSTQPPSPSPQKATQKTEKEVLAKEKIRPNEIAAVGVVTPPPNAPPLLHPDLSKPDFIDKIPPPLPLPPPAEEVPAPPPPSVVTPPAAVVSPPAPLSPPLEREEKKGAGTTASINAVSLAGGTAESGGTTPINAPLFKFPYYLNGIENKISAQWAPPPRLPVSAEKKRTVAVIRFTVKRDGRIDVKSVAVEKSSGNSFFDASALRAIYNANPLPPLPKGITEDLRVHFEFEMRLDS